MFGNFQKPVEIIVNGSEMRIGEQIPAVVLSIEINHTYQGIPVQQGQIPLIASWVWELVQKCENDYIEYQGVLILREEVQQYKG